MRVGYALHWFSCRRLPEDDATSEKTAHKHASFGDLVVQALAGKAHQIFCELIMQGLPHKT